VKQPPATEQINGRGRRAQRFSKKCQKRTLVELNHPAFQNQPMSNKVEFQSDE
jgi:hypothetical protein